LNEVTIFQDEEVRVGFDLTGHRLVRGCEGELGDPVEAFENLYAVRDSEVVKRISSPDDLSSITSEIRDVSQALEFVHLFTSPDLFFLFEKSGGAIDLFNVPDGTDQEYGSLPESRFRELGLREPSVTETEGAFVIERNLVTFSSFDGPRKIKRVLERVSKQGEYELVKQEEIADVEADEVLVPAFE
jgi:hypothetical protein